MDFRGKVSVEKHGRSGYVHVVVEQCALLFHWEYGGGNCIAMVAVPNPEEWSTLDPHATIELAPEALYFLEPS